VNHCRGDRQPAAGIPEPLTRSPGAGAGWQQPRSLCTSPYPEARQQILDVTPAEPRTAEPETPTSFFRERQIPGPIHSCNGELTPGNFSGEKTGESGPCDGCFWMVRSVREQQREAGQQEPEGRRAVGFSHLPRCG